MLETPPGQLGEEAFNGIEPFLDLVLLMRSVIVEDHMDRLVPGYFALDPIEEADKLLMTMTLHVLPDDGSVEHVERGKQRGRAMALVVVGQGSGAAFLHR